MITHPYPNLNVGLPKPPFKFGHGSVITFHSFKWMSLLILALNTSFCGYIPHNSNPWWWDYGHYTALSMVDMASSTQQSHGGRQFNLTRLSYRLYGYLICITDKKDKKYKESHKLVNLWRVHICYVNSVKSVETCMHKNLKNFMRENAFGWMNGLVVKGVPCFGPW